jgi:hypothetical protein
MIMGGGIHLGFDGTTLLVLIIIVALVASAAAFVGPKLTEASNAIADVQYAPMRAQAKVQNEIALAKAQADGISARAEISRTQALAAADVARMNAQTTLEQAKAKGASDLARIAADEHITAQIWQTIFGLGFALVLLCGIGLGGYLRVRNAQNERFEKTEQLRIEAQRLLLASAIDRMGTMGGQVTLENGRQFTIFKPELPALPVPASQAIAAGTAESPVPVSLQQPAERANA